MMILFVFITCSDGLANAGHRVGGVPLNDDFIRIYHRLSAEFSDDTATAPDGAANAGRRVADLTVSISQHPL